MRWSRAIYLISTVAPAASSCALTLAASSLEIASLTAFGARLDQILGLLQAQAGQRADLLDDVDLLGARRPSGSRRTRSAPRPARPRARHRRRRPPRRPVPPPRRPTSPRASSTAGLPRGRSGPKDPRPADPNSPSQPLPQRTHARTPARRAPLLFDGAQAPACSARAASTRAICPPGACSRPDQPARRRVEQTDQLARSSSSDGSSARARTEAASSSVPLRPPPMICSLSFFLPNSVTIRGAAVGSLRERDRGRTLEQRRHRRERRAVHGPLRQLVLGHPERRTGRPDPPAEIGDLRHGQALIVGEDDHAGLRRRRRSDRR